jgi:hypothetical protein
MLLFAPRISGPVNCPSAGAVDERRSQQRQRHAEEHAGRRRPRDLRGLEQLAVDVLEARADEQVDERREREPGDDDDPGQRVDVDRALVEVVPPGQVAEERVEVAGVGREEKRPAEHARDRGNDDRQEREDLEDAETRRQRARGPRERRSENERDRERAERELDRPPQGLPDARLVERLAVCAPAVREREPLQPDEGQDDEIREDANEDDQPESRREEPDANGSAARGGDLDGCRCLRR